jgi:hypothetical protein
MYHTPPLTGALNTVGACVPISTAATATSNGMGFAFPGGTSAPTSR